MGYHIDPHIISDSNTVLLFLGGSFFRPFRVLYGTLAKDTIVTLISDQQGDTSIFSLGSYVLAGYFENMT